MKLAGNAVSKYAPARTGLVSLGSENVAFADTFDAFGRAGFIQSEVSVHDDISRCADDHLGVGMRCDDADWALLGVQGVALDSGINPSKAGG